MVQQGLGIAHGKKKMFLGRNIAQILVVHRAAEGDMRMAFDQARHQGHAAAFDRLGAVGRQLAPVAGRGYTARRRHNLVFDLIAQDADIFQFYLADVPGFHEQRGLARLPHARGSAGDKNVAGGERYGLAQDRDNSGDIENHVGGRGILHHLAVQPGLNMQALAAGWQFVCGYEEGPEGTGGVEILADGPLRGLRLEIPDRSVVENRVANDMIEGLAARDMAPALADDGHHLARVVELTGGRRPDDGRPMADRAGGKAGEDRGIYGNDESALDGVVYIVQPDADDLAWMGERRLEIDGVEVDGAAAQQARGGRLETGLAADDQPFETTGKCRIGFQQAVEIAGRRGDRESEPLLCRIGGKSHGNPGWTDGERG